MGEINENCRVVEHHKYWNEFEPNTHLFFKIMIGDFEHQLRLPKKFVRNFKGDLSDTISLKGPSGHMWTTKLVRTVDQVVFQNGWEKFVRDHSLEIYDFLLFRYNDSSSFSVKILDKSGCELESSYFVKKHGSSCSDKACVLEMNEKEFPGDSREDTMQKGNANKGGQNACSKPSTSGLKLQKQAKDKGIQGIKPMQDGKGKKGKESSCSKVAASMSKHKKPVGVKGKGIQGKEPIGAHEDAVQGGTSRQGRQKWCQREDTKGKGIRGMKHIGLRLMDESSEGESVHVMDLSGFQQRTRPKNPRLSDSNNKKGKRKLQDTDQDDVVEILSTEEDSEEEQVHANQDQGPTHGKGKNTKSTYKKRGSKTTCSHVPENHPKKKPDTTAVPSDLLQKSYPLYLISNRRPVTEEETQRAYRLASQHSPTGPFVMVTMTSTCVYKYFYVTFPKKWGTMYISGKDEKIHLRVPPGENTWVVQFKNNKWKCGILGRWANFVEDNNLEENDVCIFQLNPTRKANQYPIVLDVTIFRVVDELVPLTRLTNPRAVAKH